MVLQDKKRDIPRRFFGQFPGIFPIALFLAGCAVTSSTVVRDPALTEPDLNQAVIAGQGTAEQRNAIKASDQRIFDAEHADGPAAAPAALPQSQSGIP